MIAARRLAFGVPLLVGLSGFGCDGGRVHPFSAFLYDTDGDCLQPAAVVDVLSGPDPGPCAELRCWESPAGDVFVTDLACEGPLDFQDRTTDSAGPCGKALAAFARKAEGRCPTPPADAGT